MSTVLPLGEVDAVRPSQRLLPVTHPGLPHRPEGEVLVPACVLWESPVKNLTPASVWDA